MLLDSRCGRAPFILQQYCMCWVLNIWIHSHLYFYRLGQLHLNNSRTWSKGILPGYSPCLPLHILLKYLLGESGSGSKCIYTYTQKSHHNYIIYSILMYMISGSNPNCCVLPWFFSHKHGAFPKRNQRTEIPGYHKLQRYKSIHLGPYISALRFPCGLRLLRIQSMNSAPGTCISKNSWYAASRLSCIYIYSKFV